MSVESDLKALLPPHDAAAEKDLLGSILRDNTTMGDASREVAADDFYSYAHKQIWMSYLRVSVAGKPIDPVVLWNDLQAAGATADIGGAGYIVELFQSAPSSANSVHYARIVRQKSKLRRIIHAAAEMQREALDATNDPDAIVARAAEVVFGLSDYAASKTVSWETALTAALDTLDRRAGKTADGEMEQGLMTGWPRLDQLTGGLHKKELVVLAARPSVGKTLAALNIIDSVAATGGKVFFASIEQGSDEIIHRILSRKSGLNSYKFRVGRFSPIDTDDLCKAVDRVRPYKVWINDGASQPLSTVISESRRLKLRHGLDMVVVDYLGLIEGERKRGTRSEEIGVMTRGLKILAKDMGVVVLCLAQLNRGPEYRAGGRPKLSDLRESGDIEQDADTVFMLHKPEEKDSERTTDVIDWLIEKQRNGPCGSIGMIHHKPTFDIREVAPTSIGYQI